MCSSECACDCVSFFLLLRVFNFFFFFIAVVDTSHTHNFLSFLVMKSSFKKCFLGRGVGVAIRKRKLCTEWDRIKYRVNQKKKKLDRFLARGLAKARIALASVFGSPFVFLVFFRRVMPFLKKSQDSPRFESQYSFQCICTLWPEVKRCDFVGAAIGFFVVVVVFLVPKFWQNS